eukprot:scaffold203359_cov35-Attheya_sp.AAC.1
MTYPQQNQKRPTCCYVRASRVAAVLALVVFPFFSFSLINWTEIFQDYEITTYKSFRDVQISDEALKFVLSRRTAFENVGMGHNWRSRGLGYLYIQHKVILVATLPDPEHPAVGQNTILIHNVHPESELRNDCNLFTIWVRVRGPEIMAGSAQAVEAMNEQSCYWIFNFELQVDGEYGVDAKGLIWNGAVEHTDKMKCNVKEGKLPADKLKKYPIHAGFQAFKLYWPEIACCEICSRLRPHCKYWASPPLKMKNPGFVHNGCELLFSSDVPTEVIPRSCIFGDINTTLSHYNTAGHRNRNLKKEEEEEVVYTHGRPHNAPLSYFIGCGWSNWFTLDFPCLSAAKDDQVFMTQNTFYFHRPKSDTIVSQASAAPSLPLCTLENERFDQSDGRWVREAWPNSETCPAPIYTPSNNLFHIINHDGAHPHCWHRDDFTRIGKECMEVNCDLIREDSKWISPLRANETKWMGVWRQRTCDYYEYTDTELQQCFNERKVSEIKVEGLSIAEFLNEYLERRLQNLTLFNDDTSTDSISVILNTFALVHHSWIDDKVVLEKLSAADDVDSRQEHFWVSGFYISSERDTYANSDRMNDINHMAYERLTPKGYKMLNLYDLSGAFSYDTSTQFDGLHIIGPPMKMVMTKLFHFLCKDTVKGSRL